MDLRNLVFKVAFNGNTSAVTTMNSAVDNLKSNMSQVSSRTTVATSSVKDMSGNSGLLSGAIKGIGVAVAGAFAVQKVVEFGKSIVEAAGSAKAMEAQFSQTFGELEPVAQTAIDTMADKFGMVSNRLKPSMSQMTSMFKGLGLDTEAAMAKATDAVTLSADAAAFYDKSYADANSGLTSFIKGNYEGGEAIGLFANDTQMANFAIEKGLVSSTAAWSSLDEATKQATRLEYAQNMQSLAGATGQASREQDGLENQLGNVKQAWQDFLAIVGGPVLGIAIEGLKGVTSALQGAGNNITFLQDGFNGIGDPDALSVLSAVAYDAGQSFSFLADGFAGIGDPDALSGVDAIAYSIGKTANVAKGAFDDAVSKVREAMPKIIEAAQPIVTAFQNLWGNIEPLFMYLTQTISEYVIPALSEMFNAFVDNLPAIINFITPIYQVLTNVIGFVGNVVGFVVALIRGDWSSAWEFAGAAVKNVVDTIGSIFNFLWSIVSGVLQNIANKATETWESIIGTWNAAVGFFSGIVAGIQGVFGGVSDFIVNSFNGAVSFLQELPSKFLGWGADMVQGLVDGIRGAIGAVGDAVQAVADKITSFLHFSRPDVGPLHYYESWMPDFMQGLAGGITGNMHLVENAVAGLSANMSVGIDPTIARANTATNKSNASGGGNSITIKNEFHITVGAGANAKEVVDNISSEWEANMDRYIKKLKLRSPEVYA